MTSVPKKSLLLLACPGSSSPRTSSTPPTISLQAHGEKATATIQLSLNDLGLGGCRVGEEAMAIPNDVDSQLAGFLKGHLVDLFVGKTWFSLALIIQPGRLAGISFFNHTHSTWMLRT